MIYKNIISFKISFCHMKREIADNREYFAKQNDIFPRK